MFFTDPIGEFLGAWSIEIGALSIIFRIALAIIFSAILGCERSAKRHAAGLRTFMTVTLSGTMAMLLDCMISQSFPIISAAIVIGAAILSSNCVLFDSRSQIRGLTTSVGLWGSGIMGLALGAGLYTLSLIGLFALISSLVYFPPIEKYLKDRSNHFEIHLELKSKANLQDFVTTIRRLGLKIDDIELNPAYANSGISVYTVSVTIKSEELKKYKTHYEIIEALKSLDYIYYIDEI